MPAAMKHTVAIMDRGDRREMPQMPWPLVQPDPYRVLIPTRNPAIATVCSGTSNVIEGSMRASA